MKCPITIFYVYAETDDVLRQQLEKHLALLRRQGVIAGWQEIQAGTPWEEQMEQALNEAKLILLLVSADFLNSDVCYEQQMQRALEREHQGEVQVIPILLHAVDWKNAPFAHLQVLPANEKPITSWFNQEEALTEVAAGIRKVVEDLVLFGASTPDTEVPQHVPSLSPMEVPFPPPSQSRGKRIGIIVGSGLLLLLLIGAGVFTQRYYSVPSHNPYALNMGTLVLNDPLHDNSQGYKWDEEPASVTGTACDFIGGAYHITAGVFETNICRPGAANLDFSDLTYEVKITIVKGDMGGIVFRDNPTTNFSYVFTVDIQGNYTLSNDDGSGHLSTLKSGTNVAIDNGPVPSNLLAIVATGNMISLYVNTTQLVAQVQDISYKRGQIGIYAMGGDTGSDIIASDVRVWKP